MSAYRKENDREYRSKCKTLLVIFPPDDLDLFDWMRARYPRRMSSYVRELIRKDFERFVEENRIEP